MQRCNSCKRCKDGIVAIVTKDEKDAIVAIVANYAKDAIVTLVEKDEIAAKDAEDAITASATLGTSESRLASLVWWRLVRLIHCHSLNGAGSKSVSFGCKR